MQGIPVLFGNPISSRPPTPRCSPSAQWTPLSTPSPSRSHQTPEDLPLTFRTSDPFATPTKSGRPTLVDRIRQKIGGFDSPRPRKIIKRKVPVLPPCPVFPLRLEKPIVPRTSPAKHPLAPPPFPLLPLSHFPQLPQTFPHKSPRRHGWDSQSVSSTDSLSPGAPADPQLLNFLGGDRLCSPFEFTCLNSPFLSLRHELQTCDFHSFLEPRCLICDRIFDSGRALGGHVAKKHPTLRKRVKKLRRV